MQLVHHHLHTLAQILGGAFLLSQRPFQIVCHREQLCHRVGGGVGVNGLFLPVAALAEVVVFRRGAQKLVFQLPGLRAGLLQLLLQVVPLLPKGFLRLLSFFQLRDVRLLFRSFFSGGPPLLLLLCGGLFRVHRFLLFRCHAANPFPNLSIVTWNHSWSSSSVSILPTASAKYSMLAIILP